MKTWPDYPLLTECQARHVSGLLGRVHGLTGNLIPMDAVYFWIDAYYPTAELAYYPDLDAVVMPDFSVWHGDLLLYLYRPEEE